MKNLGKTILKVLAIVVISCLAASFILRAVGASNMVVDLIYRLSYRAFMVIVVAAGTLILRSYSEHRWKKKNRAGITEYDKVLQYGKEEYRIPFMGFIVFSALMILLFFDFDSYYEMLTTWEKPLNILMPWVIGLVTFVYFYYLSRKKVFYSDYYLKIFPLFGKAQEIPWSRLRQVEISQDMYQCVLATEFKTYKFETNPWSDGWDDFIKTVAEMAEKYNIPYTQL